MWIDEGEEGSGDFDCDDGDECEFYMDVIYVVGYG